MSIMFPFGASLPAGRCNKSHAFSECNPELPGLGGRRQSLSIMWVEKCRYSYEHQGKHFSAAGVSQQIQPRLIRPKVPYSRKEAFKRPGEEAVIQLAMSKSRIMYYVFLTRVCMRSMRSHPSTACSLMNAVVKPERNCNGWQRERRSGQGAA